MLFFMSFFLNTLETATSFIGEALNILTKFCFKPNLEVVTIEVDETKRAHSLSETNNNLTCSEENKDNKAMSLLFCFQNVVDC